MDLDPIRLDLDPIRLDLDPIRLDLDPFQHYNLDPDLDPFSSKIKVPIKLEFKECLDE